MLKNIRNNLINDYSTEVVIKYFSNSYLSLSKLSFIENWTSNILNANGFLHITTSLENITKSNKLICSAGGLGGVIYVTPLIKKNQLNNLASYIYKKELPMFLNDANNKIDSVIIKFERKIKIGYVDYLSFGTYYYQILKNDKNINLSELLENANDIILKIKTIKLLSKNNTNFNKIIDIINTENVLKIFLFEALTEFLIFYNKNLDYTDANIGIAKDIIYTICPNLKKNFSLANFEINYEKLLNFISKIDFIESSNIEKYLKNRLLFYFNKYLINNKNNLYGQILFRNFNYRSILEEKFSKMLWNVAKKLNYDVITYILPKGEMGILPNENLKIFSGDVKNEYVFTKGQLYVMIESELSTNNIMR